jgi:hypothetical protein
MTSNWKGVSIATHGMPAVNKALYCANPSELRSEGKVRFPPVDDKHMILRDLWEFLPGLVLMDDVPNEILLTMAAMTRDSCVVPDDSLLKSMLDNIAKAGPGGAMLNHVNGKEMCWRITLEPDGSMVMEDAYFNQQVKRSNFIYEDADSQALILYGVESEQQQAMTVIATKMWVLHQANAHRGKILWKIAEPVPVDIFGEDPDHAAIILFLELLARNLRVLLKKHHGLVRERFCLTLT